MDKTGKHTDSLMIGALIMFFSYLLGEIILKIEFSMKVVKK